MTLSTSSPDTKINVMLVDDSSIVRSFITNALKTENDINIISSVSNGEMAINSAKRNQPDIVLLDIEMPVMDGITALPEILKAAPKTKVIMCSTLTTRNAEITMKAFELGATECLAKPSNSAEIHGFDDFKSKLVNLVRSLGQRTKFSAGLQVNKPRDSSAPPANPATAQTPAAATPKPSSATQKAPATAETFTLRNNPTDYKGKPAILAIGSSTGGPQALFKMVRELKGIDIPIILTQHMPATFTKILADHITKQTGVTAVEAEQGMPLECGRIHIAPGGFHMVLEGTTEAPTLALTETPPENFCRPSVDPMIRSAIDLYGNKVLGVILTGMGQDGLPSCQSLVAAGGRVIAQDEDTSVVWGMPGAVATHNICSAVLPLEDIGPWIRKATG